MLLFRGCVDFTFPRYWREHRGIPNFEQTGSLSDNATSGQVRDHPTVEIRLGFNDRS
jgi:hypothetical protein